jgi:hypothetical protein
MNTWNNQLDENGWQQAQVLLQLGQGRGAARLSAIGPEGREARAGGRVVWRQCHTPASCALPPALSLSHTHLLKTRFFYKSKETIHVNITSRAMALNPSAV